MAGTQGRGPLFHKVQSRFQPLNAPGCLDRAAPPGQLLELAHLKWSGARSKSIPRLQARSTGIDGGFDGQAQIPFSLQETMMDDAKAGVCFLQSPNTKKLEFFCKSGHQKNEIFVKSGCKSWSFLSFKVRTPKHLEIF